MDPLKDHPFVREYLDKLQAHTGTREVSPALRILLEHLAHYIAMLPPPPLMVMADRAIAADLRAGPPGEILWRKGDPVFFDTKTGEHKLRDGTVVKVRPATTSPLEQALENLPPLDSFASGRELIQSLGVPEALLGAPSAPGSAIRFADGEPPRFQFSPETLRKKGPPLEVANVEIAPFVISDHPSAQELVDQLIADAEAEARSKEGIAPECPLCKLEISDVNDPKVVQPIRGGYVHVACHDRTFGNDIPPTPSTTILNLPITLKTLDHEALTAAEKLYGLATVEFKAPPEGLPIAELTGPGVSQAHFTCERCNGSGVTGPELGTCGECNGAGGKVIDMAAEVAVEPPPLTPEQLAAHVCETCGQKGHRFFDCPREVHF